MTTDSRLTRVSSGEVKINNSYGIDARLFAKENVPIESAAVTELLEMLELQKTISDFSALSPESFNVPPEIKQIAVTPDFHKAKGIPVGTVLATKGFVVPQAVGKDINCGMRMHLTSISKDQIEGKLDELENIFRHIFFEGGRNIPMSGLQREALFRNGLAGLLDSTPRTMNEGLWSLFHDLDIAGDLERIDFKGSLKSGSTFGLKEFIGPKDRLTRDTQIGSIGGGNHFVEIQYVDNIIDGSTAHAWGIKPGMVTVMIHTGSVSIGHLCGSYYRDVTRELYPKKLKQPSNGIFILPTGEMHRDKVSLFWDSFYNAANFAFANRAFLGLMALDGLNKVCGDIDFPLLYDAPHNLMWNDSADPDLIIHRKGACPARGFDGMKGTPFKYYGEPVLVPGSMGTSSFILAGKGNNNSLQSACHGAGRTLSRGNALKGNDQQFNTFMNSSHLVTATDLNRPDIKLRRDIVERKLEEIKQEAPHAYKDIYPIIETLEEVDIARPVAELKPLLTIKG